MIRFATGEECPDTPEGFAAADASLPEVIDGYKAALRAAVDHGRARVRYMTLANEAGARGESPRDYNELGRPHGEAFDVACAAIGMLGPRIAGELERAGVPPTPVLAVTEAVATGYRVADAIEAREVDCYAALEWLRLKAATPRWSKPHPPKFWRRVFEREGQEISQETFLRMIERGEIRAEKISDKSYRVDLRDVPPGFDDR